MKKKLNHIIQQFKIITGDFLYTKLDSGLINTTFKITTKDNQKSYILQKINTKVFPEYKKLMSNILKVSDYINSQIAFSTDITYVNAQLYTTIDNKPYYRDETHDIWRLFAFIENELPNYDDKIHLANETGKILGIFHMLTKDISIKDIYETIPDFHNINLRWEKLVKVVRKNNNRYIETIDIFQKICEYENIIDRYNELTKGNSLPLRIVHNDPKLSNILFKDNKAISLIDHDTIMPGYLPVDFGDAVRSLCNTSTENEKDIEKVNFDFDSFKAFSKSYLKIMKGYLSKNELKCLDIFPSIITLEQSIRFYTDYLEGDIYYNISYPNQNLIRTNVQLELLEKMYHLSSQISKHILSI